jgi:hypothetical protein
MHSRSWTEPDEDRNAYWIGPIDRFQRGAYSIHRNLSANGRRDAWQRTDFAVVAHGIGLDVCKWLFLETRRQRLLADEQFVCSSCILEPYPCIVLLMEFDRRLEKVAIFLGGILKGPGSAIHSGAGPVSMREGFVVHHRSGSSRLVF